MLATLKIDEKIMNKNHIINNKQQAIKQQVIKQHSIKQLQWMQ
jgi:ribosomal protein L35